MSDQIPVYDSYDAFIEECPELADNQAVKLAFISGYKEGMKFIINGRESSNG